MEQIYELTGTYQEPFYYGESNCHPDDSEGEEICEELHYKYKKSETRILGLYNSLKEVEAAKKRFSNYFVITKSGPSYEETAHPYTNITYRELKLGDREILPKQQIPDDYHPIQYQVPKKYQYWSLIKHNK